MFLLLFFMTRSFFSQRFNRKVTFPVLWYIFIIPLFLLVSHPVSACDAKIVDVSATEICGSSGDVSVTLSLSGTPEFTVTLLAGEIAYRVNGILNSTYVFRLTGDQLGGAGTYKIKLVAFADYFDRGDTDTTTYYVTVKNTAPPSGAATQEFCASEAAVLSDLIVSGSSIKWYAGQSGGVALSGNTLLAAKTYWSSQTVNNCESTDRLPVLVKLNDPGAPEGEGSPVFCSDSPMQISSLNAEGENIKWYNVQSGGTALQPGAVLITGNYWATQTKAGCESAVRLAVSVSIVVPPIPDLGPDTVLCHGNTLVLDPGDFSSYLWSTGETGGTLTVTEGIGLIRVTVKDEHGCEGSDNVMVDPCNPAELLGTIPNIFTPNGDNYHDTWVIENIGYFPVCDIKIYDRGGRLVYECSNGYGNDWNGEASDGKDLPAATYYYIINLNIPGVEALTGTITILR
jgi:gliding motility-associated-like protein